MRARERSYDFGSILEATKAVDALSFDLEQKTKVSFQCTCSCR